MCVNTLAYVSGPASAPAAGAGKRLADGYPDPRMGENTVISAAMGIKLAQVYVVHPQDGHELLSAR